MNLGCGGIIVLREVGWVEGSRGWGEMLLRLGGDRFRLTGIVVV